MISFYFILEGQCHEMDIFEGIQILSVHFIDSFQLFE
jgi:hypothetical protein